MELQSPMVFLLRRLCLFLCRISQHCQHSSHAKTVGSVLLCWPISYCNRFNSLFDYLPQETPGRYASARTCCRSIVSSSCRCPICSMVDKIGDRLQNMKSLNKGVKLTTKGSRPWFPRPLASVAAYSKRYVPVIERTSRESRR